MYGMNCLLTLSKELEHVSQERRVSEVVDHVHGAPEDEQQQADRHLDRYPDYPRSHELRLVLGWKIIITFI